MKTRRGTGPWGKLVGGALGLALGGPFGAALGVLVGHSVDEGLAPLLGGGGLDSLRKRFFETAFRLIGYLSKADGRVSEQEVAFAEQLMARMALEPAARQAAIRLFNEGKSREFDAVAAVAAFRDVSAGQHELRRLLLEILIDAALADGRLKSEGRSVLRVVASGLSISERELDAILAMRIPAERVEAEPYRILGISHEASMEEVRRAYRRLTARHHPDKLMSQGLPEAMMRMTEEKTREIRWAYEQIRKERGLH